MAFNGIVLSCFVILLLTFTTAQAAFEFPNNLKGYTKGTRSKDVHQLKIYLHKFGYLSQNPIDSKNDVFNDALEIAIKTYQTNFHLNPTGVIDEETVAIMKMPRCGVADIVNGTNFMRAKDNKEPSSSGFHTVAHYQFFDGRPRWPSDHTDLTYGFLPNVPARVQGPVRNAFGTWASATFFTFSQAQNYQSADLTIGWFSGDHGDGAPFDGPGPVLAHAFPPTNGRFHYDADQTWSVEPEPGAIHLESVATHEIGHLLGLEHSMVEAAIMYPTIGAGVRKVDLNADDLNGINALYS